MEDEDEIRKFVRFKLYKGRYLCNIFNELCQEFCGISPGLENYAFALWYMNLRFTIENCFPSKYCYDHLISKNQVSEGPPTLKFRVEIKEPPENYPEDEGPHRVFDEIPPYEFHLALRILFTEFAIAKSACKSRGWERDYDVVGCKMLTERYAIDVKTKRHNGRGNELTFYLIDTLHDEKRKLQLNTIFPSNATVYALTPLDSKHFLCSFYYFRSSMEEQGEINPPDVYLFKVNADRLDCNFLDKYALDVFMCREILVDLTDPRKFLLLCEEEIGGDFSYKGQVTADGKLEIGEKMELEIKISGKDFGYYCQSYGYSDGKFYGLGQLSDDDQLSMVEANFERGKLHVLRLFNFKADMRYEHERGEYAWARNVCYVLLYRQKQENCIYKFDLDTQQTTRISVPLYDEEVSCNAMYNGVMIVGTHSGEKLNAWHRIPLNQPVTLLNLSMECLQKDAIFIDIVERAKFIQKLPPNLRQFGHKYNCQ